MKISDLPVFDPRALIVDLRAELVALIAGLSDAEWVAPTEAGHWRVKEVALHLLDNDLGHLSRARDRDLASLLPRKEDYRSFVRSLDEKNERWVVAAGGLSRPVVADLLRWSGNEITSFYSSLDLRAESHVIWAGPDPVPAWFDLSRNLTEEWVHQKHIRYATGRPGNHDVSLPVVLRTFVWAFPHQYRAQAAAGATVRIELGEGAIWTLKAEHGGGWTLVEGALDDEPNAVLSMTGEAAWRQLTGLSVDAVELRVRGNPSLLSPLLEVRGIIA